MLFRSEQLAAADLSAKDREKLQDKLTDAEQDRKGLTLASNLTDSLTGEGMSKGLAGTVGGVVSAAAKNPELAYYKMKANAYKFSWMLILISIPFVWMLFPFRREYKGYDHAIYATYSITFMSLLFSLSMVLTATGLDNGLITLGLLLFAAWHMYRQFKDAYQLSRTGALLRLPLLYLFACISLSLFFTLLVIMG